MNRNKDTEIYCKKCDFFAKDPTQKNEKCDTIDCPFFEERTMIKSESELNNKISNGKKS